MEFAHDAPDPSTPESSRAGILLKAGALQRAILSSATFSSIATDAMGVIQVFNVGAERMLGYAPDEVINRITPADISDPKELVARAAALSTEFGTTIAPGFESMVFRASRGIEDIYELTYIRKDGSWLPAVVSVTALRSDADEIIGYLLIGTDNTARKLVEEERQRLEQALRLKNAELETANRMKSEFLANMSHELRTPLNAIIGFSEVMRDGLVGPMSDSQRGFIGDIFSSGKHLLALINDILDLSKVEAGKMTLDLEPVDIASVFANSLAIIREKAAARRIRVVTEIAADLGVMQLDVRKAKQILYNLLSNAVKFTGVGGEVTLRARRVSCAEAGQRFSTWPAQTFSTIHTDADDLLEISVLDNGIGISIENMSELFAPFSQIDGGLARRFEGTGLGLAMVKQLTELHGGIVAVESAVAEGSCFTTWLPVRQLDPVTGTPAVATERPAIAPGTRTALMVEDDPKSAELVRVQLESEGFTVLHAVSAEAALELATLHPLSLVTLDIMLPKMDGWEFLGRIKQIDALRGVPVVIISIVADRSKGFALGATAVLEKPISRKVLYESLTDIGLLPMFPGGNLKVLIVDDDPMALELIAVRITSLASQVLRAHGGQEAIELARRELPDLIVLDLMMPDVNGFDVVAALHEQVSTSCIPIVVVTAKRVTDEDRARLHGQVAAVIEKVDFDRDRFIGEVRRAMAGRPVIG